MASTFYAPDELPHLGLKSFGKNVLISRKASLITPELIEIGNHVRVDDFCILSGSIIMGSYIHISAYTAIYAKFGVVLGDFVTVSGRVMIYSQNDDYSGRYLTNPMVPSKYTNATGARVILKKHSIIAAGSIILPGITLGEGACVGAHSLVKNDVPDWCIFAGVPAKKIGNRSDELLLLEQQLKADS